MNHWRALGLKRTDDVGEIRRAYARKLKATDVEADPAAFVALRAAFEHAIADAEATMQRQTAGEGEPPPTGEETIAAHAPEPAIEDVGAAAAAEAAAHGYQTDEPDLEPEAGEDPNARYIALGNLLFPGEGAPPPDPDTLVASVRAIIDHPEMELVDRGAEVENWLAGMLYDAGAYADPAIPMAVAHFHWDKKAGHWDQPWLLEALVQRRDALRLLDNLANPNHPLHHAWRDLRSDDAKIGLVARIRNSDVLSLVNKIRQEAPAAEYYLNPNRIALWEDRWNRRAGSDGGGSTFNWIWIGMVALVALGRLGSAINGPSTPVPSTSPLLVSSYADPNLDLDPFVQDASQNSLHFADLDRRNPALHDRLLDRWNLAYDRHDPRFSFSGDVRTILEQAVSEGLRGGSYDLQAAFWRLRADQLRWLRGADVESCGRLIRGDMVNRTLPVEYSNRLRAIQARALGQSVRNPPAALPPGRGNTYRIPGPVVEDALRRSGLTESVLTQTFRGRGTSAQLCAGSIALLDAALSVPERQGARLLRDMSRGL